MLEYHQQHRAYLENYASRSQQTTIVLPKAGLRRFSKPLTSGVAKHTSGYDNRSISDDIIAEIFNGWCERTRVQESEEYLCTEGGELYTEPAAVLTVELVSHALIWTSRR